MVSPVTAGTQQEGLIISAALLMEDAHNFVSAHKAKIMHIPLPCLRNTPRKDECGLSEIGFGLGIVICVAMLVRQFTRYAPYVPKTELLPDLSDTTQAQYCTW